MISNDKTRNNIVNTLLLIQKILDKTEGPFLGHKILLTK